MSYNSKYTGQQVEETLDAVKDKVDKVAGKQLTSEDFTTALKQKLEGLSNYDDTAINEAVNTLRKDFDTLVSGDSTTAIKTFNEIIAFLSGIEDSESLDSIIASIEQQIAGKADTTSLAAVATSGSYNDLRDKPTIPTVPTTDNVAYPLESHTEATLEITPNVMHVWGEMAALTVTLGAEVEGRANEFLFQFSSPATATTLTLPSTLTWANGEALAPEANKTYQVSIVNSYAIYTTF